MRPPKDDKIGLILIWRGGQSRSPPVLSTSYAGGSGVAECETTGGALHLGRLRSWQLRALQRPSAHHEAYV